MDRVPAQAGVFTRRRLTSGFSAKLEQAGMLAPGRRRHGFAANAGILIAQPGFILFGLSWNRSPGRRSPSAVTDRRLLVFGKFVELLGRHFQMAVTRQDLGDRHGHRSRRGSQSLLQAATNRRDGAGSQSLAQGPESWAFGLMHGVQD